MHEEVRRHLRLHGRPFHSALNWLPACAVALLALGKATPGASGFHLLVLGQDALVARATLAAQRGVRVRLLVDDIYAVGRDIDFATLAAHPNVQVRVFNPFRLRGPLGISQLFEYLGDSSRLNRRMHNKLWIADNAVAVIGGRNLGDANFNMHADSDFADLDVLATGPVVVQMSRSFDAYWNSDLAIPIAAFVGTAPSHQDVTLILSRMAAQATLHDTAVPSQVPDTQQHQPVTTAVSQLMQGAQQEALLVSPYFVPSEPLASLWRRLSAGLLGALAPEELL